MEYVINAFKKFEEPIMYIIFGGLTTLVNYVTYFSLTRFLFLEYVVSNVVAWVVAVIFAYITNKIWVFKTKNKKTSAVIRELVMFMMARVFSGFLDTALLILFVEMLSVNDMIVKIFNGLLVVFVNYFLSKFVIFKKHTKDNNK